jgi:transcriptional regulator with XRE-family HTH domain
MKERILEFLKSENKSSAQLADEIGVQASGISHILSGRNNPSLDFVLKMLEKYKFLSTDWLLFGRGMMYNDPKMQSLFDEEILSDKNTDQKQVQDIERNSEFDFVSASKTETKINSELSQPLISNPVKKIVWFYDNNSFEEYFPAR